MKPIQYLVVEQRDTKTIPRGQRPLTYDEAKAMVFILSSLILGTKYEGHPWETVFTIMFAVSMVQFFRSGRSR